MSAIRKWFHRGKTRDAHSAAAAAVPAPTSADLEEIRVAEKSFLDYMAYRRRQMESQVGRTTGMALRVVPLLLHCNQPGVPGYIDDKRCPVGIGNYQPSDADFRLARTFFSTPLRRTGIFRPFVEVVAAMGSVGTIAFARDSDLDLWVCYDEFAADAEKLAMFEEKVRQVEQWLAQVSGRPCCLFLQSSKSVRDNRFGETSAEGCGSAMGLILKEEFYRTHIHLAGRYPFWWLADPGLSPEAYGRFVRFTLMDDDFHANQYVDLGPAASPSLEEYFGAAIWQIVKAWRSPLKSVLKMALLQRSIHAGETASPLCEHLKQTVRRGEKVDPYRLLFEEALAGCAGLQDAPTAQLLGTCFYLKSATKLDPAALQQKAKLTENQVILQQFADSWGWDAQTVTRLNNFFRWKYEDVRDLNQEINEYLIATYGEIRSVLQGRVQELTITDRDLTVLGRKLHAIYGLNPGKVGVMPILSQGMEEEYLSLHQMPTADGSEQWGLFRGLIKHWDLERQGDSLLRTNEDPLHLLTWAARNGLLGATTRLLGRSPSRFLSPTYMDNVARSLTTFFQSCEGLEVSSADLLAEPEIHRLLVMPNFGKEEEDIGEIAAVYWTSWGETFYRKWQGTNCFEQFVTQVFAPYLLRAPDPEGILMLMPTREVGRLRWSHWRIQLDFPNLAAFLGGRQGVEGETRCHLGQVGEQFFSLAREQTEVVYRAHPTARDMLDGLAGGGSNRVKTRVAAHSGLLAIIKVISDSARHGGLDVYHLYRRGREWVFVSDEVGNLIDLAGSDDGKYFVLARLLGFLRRTYPQLSGQQGSPLAGQSWDDALRVYSLEYDESCSGVVATQEYVSAVAALQLQPAPLVAELSSGGVVGDGGVALSWQGASYARPQCPDPFAAVAEQIRAVRATGEGYPYHLTEVTPLVAAGGPGAEFVTAGALLTRKKELEERLASAAAPTD